MKIVRRQFLRVVGAATVAPLFSRIARTQSSYPSRPITIVVPYAAGGSLDVTARTLAEGLA